MLKKWLEKREENSRSAEVNYEDERKQAMRCDTFQNFASFENLFVKTRAIQSK